MAQNNILPRKRDLKHCLHCPVNRRALILETRKKLQIVESYYLEKKGE